MLNTIGSFQWIQQIFNYIIYDWGYYILCWYSFLNPNDVGHVIKIEVLYLH
jgi:hypothetical protein